LIALPSLHITAQQSPTFAAKILFPTIKTLTAVLPDLKDKGSFSTMNYSSTSLNVLVNISHIVLLIFFDIHTPENLFSKLYQSLTCRFYHKYSAQILL